MLCFSYTHIFIFLRLIVWIMLISDLEIFFTEYFTNGSPSTLSSCSTFLRQTTSSATGFSVMVLVLLGFHEQGVSAILRPICTILKICLHTTDCLLFVRCSNILFDIFNRRRGLASNSHLLRRGSWNCNCRAGGRGTGHFQGSRAREKKFSIEGFAEKPCWQSLLAGAAETKLSTELQHRKLYQTSATLEDSLLVLEDLLFIIATGSGELNVAP